MTYQGFKNEWNGRRVDYDNVYAYQCVDLILEFMKECAGVPSGISGNAIDYANRPSPAFLAAVTRVTDGNYQPGDIVVLNGLSGNPYGHIGLYDHDAGGSIALLEQNGATGGGTGTGNDKISVWRTVPKSRINTVWRLKAFQAPAPAPLPGNGTSVFLPSAGGPWHLYHIGSSYNPNDATAVQGVLRPDKFPPGLTYKIEGYVAGNRAVVITTRDFGRGVVWIANTPAQVK